MSSTTANRVAAAAAARADWFIYVEHGFGHYPNWLNSTEGRISRESVVAALEFPEVRQAAQAALVAYRQKIAEIESMLAETASPAAEEAPNAVD